MSPTHNTVAARGEGILFPKGPDGARSTLGTGQSLFASAVGAVDARAAEAVRSERHWRRRYPRHLMRQEELGLEDPGAAVTIANAGLAAIYRWFEFSRDGTVMPFVEAMEALAEPSFVTAVVEGRKRDSTAELTVPYRGELLRGSRLLRQIEDWESRHIIEPSHAEALRRVIRNRDWLDLSDQRIVLLGASAEMGPLSFLISGGATIIAVDLHRAEIWSRLIRMIRESGSRLELPMRGPPRERMTDDEMARQAGADLLTETPQLSAWLCSMGSITAVGNYAYADGKDHVRLVLAMDAISRALAAERPALTVAFLATATDAFAVPAHDAELAQSRFAEASVANLWRKPLRALTAGRLYAPNVPKIITAAAGQRYGLFDGLVLRQGPNYALAKRIQRWRALVATAKGIHVSANVAPPSNTHSVIRNRAFAAAYAGAQHYGAEIFDPQTSSTLMGALFVHDLRYDRGLAASRTILDNPTELFIEGANHGGLWCAGFQIRSVLEIAALRGFLHPPTARR